MQRTRWIVELSKPADLAAVPREELELATRLECDDGRQWLIYRDQFNALKVATICGARVAPARVVAGEEPNQPNARPLGAGMFLLVDTPVASIPRA